MKLIKDSAILSQKNSTQHFPCLVCPLAKQHCLPFPHSSHTTSALFDLIHCDLWGLVLWLLMMVPDTSCL